MNRLIVKPLVSVTVLSLMLLFAVNWSGTPYNVRELFVQRNLFWGVFSFSVFLLWMAGSSVVIESMIEGAAGFVLWIKTALSLLLFASVGWLLLRYSVSTESLWDVLGTPIWERREFLGIEDWELYFRALPPLTLVLAILLLVGVAVKKSKAIWLVLTCVGVSFFWTKAMVFDYASTDNVVELFVDSSSAFPYLIASFVLWTVPGVLLSRPPGTNSALLLVLGLAPLCIFIGCQTIQLALNADSLHFLLAPDRITPLGSFIPRGLSVVFAIVLTVILSRYSFDPILNRKNATS